MECEAETTGPKLRDTEKITINLGFVDLGQIDLLVRDGFSTNRTDFISTAIRNQVERHGDAIRRSVAHHDVELGLRRLDRDRLEAAPNDGRIR